MNRSSLKRGFTLPEVIISLSIMVMVIFSATYLVVSIIRSNSENINTLVAYGLAQEGVEAVRNIRDSNWLLGVNFNGVLMKANNTINIWGEKLPEVGEEAKTYYIEYENLVPSNELISDPNSLSRIVPWRLTEVGDLSDAILYKNTIERGSDIKEVHYTNDPEGERTGFTRYLFIKSVGLSGDKYLVSSVVTWDESGSRKKEVRLDTEITNWKD
ncbi:prepilin-type N-terminal cleavage/methylation domain-containing protein [Pseudomonadota bacterium]